MESCGWCGHGVVELLLGPRQDQHKLWVRAFKTPFQAYTLFKQLQQTMGILLAPKSARMNVTLKLKYIRDWHKKINRQAMCYALAFSHHVQPSGATQ